MLVVVTAVSALAAVISACFAAVYSKKSAQVAAALRSATSMQGELHEMRDYLGKIEQWSKRINARLAMQERRESSASSTSSSTNLAGLTDKAELRRRLGLVPGKPAPHRE